MLKTDTPNCGGLSIEVLDSIRASVFMNRSQFSKDLTVALQPVPTDRSEVCRFRPLGHAA
jgi:hypothetical protein